MYAALSDMRTQFTDRLLIQLTDEDDAGAIDQTKVTRALTDATSLIDGYARAANYKVPLTPVSSLLVRCACDIALYFLYVNSPPDNVVKAYDNQIKWLKAIKSGDVVLDVAGTIAPAADNMILTDASIVACKRDSLRGF